MLREFEDKDLGAILFLAQAHIGKSYSDAILDKLEGSTIYVLEEEGDIRSFILYRKEKVYDLLSFTDKYNKFTTATFRKFRDIIINRDNTLVIHFSKNKEILERAIKPYGGYIVLDYIIVPKEK